MSSQSLALVARGIVVASLMIGEGVRHGPGRSEFDRFFAEVMPAHPLRPTDSHPGGTMKLSHAIPLIAAIISGMSIAADPTKKTWDFEKDESGRIAKGFTSEVGQWEVAKDGDNHVLYQKAKNGDATFNVALVERTST